MPEVKKAVITAFLKASGNFSDFRVKYIVPMMRIEAMRAYSMILNSGDKKTELMVDPDMGGYMKIC
jgi:hypothetical protein